MHKILSHIIIIFFLLVTNAYSEIIKDIKISGNKRISDQTVLILGDLKLGKNYNESQLNDSLKKLYNSNFFSDIKINLENGLLLINLVENPIIEDIEISGVQNKTFIEDLYENMTLKNRMSYSEEILKRDVDLIKNILKTSGFYFANIDTSVIRNEELNSIRLKLVIDQGKKARIKEVVFIGDKKIKDKRLLEVIASEEHKFWKFISKKVYLNERLINLDKRLLTNYYKNLGFYKVEVLNSFAELDNEENSFKLVFNINAGERYSFKNLSLKLPDDYNESDFKKINKIFKKLSGERYSLDGVNLILKEIDKIASARLYDFITADVTETIVDNDKIDFEFKIVDSDKFYVERINVLGNYQTIEEVIRNRFIVDEGDPLNELLYNKSIDNIKALGIFKTVKSEIKNGSEPNLKIIELDVEEKPTGEISLAAGVGTGGSTIGGGIVEKNFLGKGVNLKTNLEISEDSVKGRFIYSKPNFNYSDNTLFTSLKSTSKDNLTDFGYKVSELGFAVGTKFEQYENLFFSPEIDITIEDLETNSSASKNLKKQEGSYEDFYFNYGLDYDKRNSTFRPSSGNVTAFYQELPMVSSNKEISNTFIFTQYKTINKATEMVGKASIYLKAINSLDNSDVRISKRAQIPYSRLRGFEKGKVGPVENNDYIGGNYVSALNFSTNLPGILSTVENIDFSYFIDVANIWGVDYDSSIDDSNSIRSSTGIGLDWLTPVGPLSFSLSKPITKKSTDKTESFRFNLGTTF